MEAAEVWCQHGVVLAFVVLGAWDLGRGRAAILERSRAKRAIKFKLSLEIFRRKCAGSDLRVISTKGETDAFGLLSRTAREKIWVASPKMAQTPTGVSYLRVATRRTRRFSAGCRLPRRAPEPLADGARSARKNLERAAQNDANVSLISTESLSRGILSPPAGIPPASGGIPPRLRGGQPPPARLRRLSPLQGKLTARNRGPPLPRGEVRQAILLARDVD